MPPDKKNITIHHLLTRTAGFVHDASSGIVTSRPQAVDFILASKLRFIPGENFAYSNSGYQLLAAIIEIASGSSYEQYLHQTSGNQQECCKQVTIFLNGIKIIL